MPKTLGFSVPILLIVCCMLGIGHPSSPPVAEFNRTKSRVYLLVSVSLFASLPNACEAVHDYMGVAIYLHLSQSSLTQPRQASYGPLGEYINEFSIQCLEFGLKLWGSFEGDLKHQLLRGLLRTSN